MNPDKYEANHPEQARIYTPGIGQALVRRAGGYVGHELRRQNGMHSQADHPHVRLGHTLGRGRGLFASGWIRKGERIASFDGAVYHWEGIWGTIPADLPGNPADHAIQFAECSARDSLGLARYANHSCQPNAGIVGLFDLVAMEAIAPGVEICWDYAMSEDSNWYIECRCGNADCRQLMG